MLFTTREIKRARVRFGVLTLGAGLLVFVLLFQQLLLDGILSGLTGALRNQSGQVIVFSKDAARNLGASTFLLTQAPATKAKLEAVPSVGAVSELSMTGAPFHAAGQTTSTADATVIGFSPGQPGEPTDLVAGRLPNGPGEVVVDRESSMGRYDLDGTITLEPRGPDLTIVGLTEDSRLNVGPTFWITMDGFLSVIEQAKLLYLGPSVFVVQPAPGSSPREVAAQLTAENPTLDAVTRQVAADTAPGLAEIKVAFSMILGLGYLITGIVIGFFFLTLTLQKAASLTLMRAVGAPSRYLVRSLLQQVLFVTTGGVLVGIGLLLAAYLAVRVQIPVTPKISTMVLSAALAFGVAVVGAIPPVRRTLRTDPFDVVGRPSLGGLS